MSDPRARLAQAITSRRQRLGLSISQAAALAGIDRNTWSTAERGERRLQDANYAGVERALRWTTGSISDVAEGRDPTPLDDDDVLARLDEAEKIITDSDMPPVEKVAWIARLRQEREETERRRVEQARDAVRLWRRAQSAEQPSTAYRA